MESTIMSFVFFAALCVYAGIIYKKLVFLRNGFRRSFAQIGRQLQRRHDLVPTLVETAKAYIGHERNALHAIAAARTQAMAAVQRAAAAPGEAFAMESLVATEGALRRALAHLFGLAESHPELKASQAMQLLGRERSQTDGDITSASAVYNDSVILYNNALDSFPDGLVAAPFGFREAALLNLTGIRDGTMTSVPF